MTLAKDGPLSLSMVQQKESYRIGLVSSSMLVTVAASFFQTGVEAELERLKYLSKCSKLGMKYD